MEKSKFDEAQVRQFIKYLAHDKAGGCWEVRCIGKNGVLSGFFDNIDDIVKSVSLCNGVYNVYLGLNPRNKALFDSDPARNTLRRGKAAGNSDIIAIREFYIDLDCQREANTNSTDAELKEVARVAKKVITELQKRHIKYILSLSGNGIHIFIRLPDCPNNKDTTAKIKQLLGWFARIFDTPLVHVDTGVHDPARIVRCPGTLNVKASHSVERPQRLCEIKTFPDEIKAHDLFDVFVEERNEQRICEMRSPSAIQKTQAFDSFSRYDLHSLDIVKVFQDNNLCHKHIVDNKHSVVCPWANQHTTGDERDTSSVIWEATKDSWPNFYCSHAHCQNRKLKDVLEYFGSETISKYCRLKGDFHHKASGEFKLTALREHMSEPDEKICWLVDGIIFRGSVILLVAKPKVGKSTLTKYLTTCVADGKEFLGRSVQKGLVVYLMFEEHRRTVKEYFKKNTPNEIDNVKMFIGRAPADIIDRMYAFASIESPALIVVDTLGKVVRLRDVNDYAQVSNGLDPILEIARKNNSAVLLIHHAKKGYSEDDIDSVLGSTALAGAADTVIVLKKRGDGIRTISTIQREGTVMPETVLKYCEERGSFELADSLEIYEVEKMEGLIKTFLGTQAEKVNEQVINESIKGDKTPKVKALRSLVNKGEVIREGGGKKGNPYLYRLIKTGLPV